jgi:hypothetical protein
VGAAGSDVRPGGGGAEGGVRFLLQPATEINVAKRATATGIRLRRFKGLLLSLVRNLFGIKFALEFKRNPARNVSKRYSFC